MSALAIAALVLAAPQPQVVDPAGVLPPPVAAPPADQPAAPPADDQAIVVTARPASPGDPAEALNVVSYQAVQAVDDAVIAPVALGYQAAVPAPARSALRAFLLNLTEPVVAVNYLLQMKPGKAAETVGRFAINSTAGAAGLFDVARGKGINLPYRANGFANTMGYYGIGPGPYFFMPLIGPTTARDLLGWGLDHAFVPSVAGRPFSHPAYGMTSGTIKSLNDRIEFDGKFKEFRESADPYASARAYYLAQRKAEIDALHGRVPAPVAGRPAGS